ncbi:hypothetical protein QBC34DRAFT_164902 [Podospora aff. communis PSN243]|uniref:DUF676 domain-containing protein n=1 Tax=Podospora aff. communis PSN243 TaxID=3040156 RepID=A0AAV9GBS2_9PEZI|nr:hypothetical protein QBC34DRAFT_164902 [Podospora aff. communis PSN243]
MEEPRPPPVSALPEPLLRPPEFELQVFPADPSATASVDIIAVHDLGENAAEAWTDGVGWGTDRSHESSDWERPRPVNWVRDLLGSDLPRSRILLFSYPAPNFEKKSASWIEYVHYVAEQLLEHIRNHRATVQQQDVPIVFIGYGFGGVVIQKAIETLVTQGSQEMQGNEEDAHQRTTRKLSVPGGIYLALFLDTPFPEPEHEDEDVARLFPPNTNVRMCDIIQRIEEHEKDSDVLERVWAGMVDAYDKSPDAEDIDVTWLYSQAKTKQHELSASDLVADKLAVSRAIDITMTSVATFKHRRLAIIPDADDYIYKTIRSRIQSTLLFQGIYLRNPDLVETILECETLTVVEDIEGKLTPLHAAAQLNPANDEIVTILLYKRKHEIMERDELGRVPLHLAIAAAWEAKPLEGLDRSDFSNVIRYLMRNMPRTDLDTRDNNGLSPWDQLCEPGECTCELDECAGDWIRDIRDTLEPISGPVDEVPKRPTKPVPPERDSTQFHASLAASGTVAEFYHVVECDGMKPVVREHINLKTPNVYDMIYHPNRGCAKILQYSRVKEESQNLRCRWVHIPANSEQWLSDLILSLGIQDDSMDEQRHDGRSLNGQDDTVPSRNMGLYSETVHALMRGSAALRKP